MALDPAYLADWANLLLRWLHLITGIAWIGTSFYFIALDNSLEPDPAGNPRIRGEQWSIHGGGVYHKRKYVNAPETLPQRLHWFKWEAYWTWISGFALFTLIYWREAETYLIDPAVLALPAWAAIAISAAMLVAGWLAYDALCRSRLARNEAWLLAAGAGLLVVAVLVATHVFSGRGAFLVIGAMTGTIMVANVAMVIIPGQQKMVAAMREGREPDPKYGAWGKQRSVHNTYLTLPVLFLMISPHYPMLTQHPLNWLALLLVALAGALIRQFFVLRHSGRSNWALPAGGAVALGLLFLMAAPRPDARLAGMEVPAFAEVEPVFATHCAACHAARPSFDGMLTAPKGVLLDSPAQIRRWAAASRAQIASEAMPPGNLTDMTGEERLRLLAWIAGGARLD